MPGGALEYSTGNFLFSSQKMKVNAPIDKMIMVRTMRNQRQ